MILEKDFWVSWLLGLLFAQPNLAPYLVFKGGTSLSKVFGVIDRFSEDIDLCLVPEFVRADAAGFDALTSRVKRDAAVLEMQRLCGEKAQQIVFPLLEEVVTDALGQPSNGNWLRYELDADAKSPILYFRYPVTQRGFAYVAREVKLELGTLTDQQPTGSCPVRPLLAETYPALFDEWDCTVTARGCSARFGRRRPYCIRNFTARSNRQRRSVTRGTTSIWQSCWRTRRPRCF